jgi:hypothetical protein
MTARTPQPHLVVIEGVIYPIGLGTQVDFETAALASPRAEWQASGTIPDNADLELVPGTSDRAFTSLIRAEPLNPDD